MVLQHFFFPWAPPYSPPPPYRRGGRGVQVGLGHSESGTSVPALRSQACPGPRLGLAFGTFRLLFIRILCGFGLAWLWLDCIWLGFGWIWLGLALAGFG